MKRIWILAILAVLVGGLIWRLHPEIPEGFGPYVLFLTLVAVVFYTWETSQLRIQQKDIMELSLKPHLIPIFRLGSIHLCNIGNGPAINIRIDDAMYSQLPTTSRLRFRCPKLLRKDESKPISARILNQDGRIEFFDPSLAMLQSSEATETVEVYVRYENLISKSYEQRVSIGKGMPNESDPIDELLSFLFAFPNVVQSSDQLSILFGNKDKLMRVLKYCNDKGLIYAKSIETDQEGVVKYQDISITSKGSDYIMGKH